MFLHVQSAVFDMFYLVYWQWSIFNHVVFFLLVQRHILYSQQDVTFFIWYTDNDSYLTMLYIFTCTEAPIVQSAGFDIFYLIYWQWLTMLYLCLLVQRHLLYSQQDLTIVFWYTDNDSYLTMLYVFTCTEAPIVQSEGFDKFYLIYWRWFIFNHVVFLYLYRGTYCTVRMIWHFLFDILTMIHI